MKENEREWELGVLSGWGERKNKIVRIKKKTGKERENIKSPQRENKGHKKKINQTIERS